jgi:hypothetical protein
MSSDGGKIFAACSPGVLFTSEDKGMIWEPESEYPSLNSDDELRLWGSIASCSNGISLIKSHWGFNPRDPETGDIIDDWVESSLYVLDNLGSSWRKIDLNIGTASWSSVTSSADGTELAAAVYGGHIYISSDSGYSWTQTAHTGNWYSISSCKDGKTLIALDYRGSIHVSTDSGKNWTESLTNEIF